MSVARGMTAGDIYGFAALLLIALAAALLLLRSKVLKLTRDIALIRGIHLAISSLAGLFLALHISTLFLPPVSTGILLGYAAIFASLAVWLTGTAFLQKVKDSLFFHGVLSSVLIPLSVMHAASASTDIPGLWVEILVAGTAVVVFANAALHIARALSSVPR